MAEQPSGDEQPGLALRLAAGFWHVPAGFVFLLRNPALWPLALLPAALATVLLVCGAVLGALAIPRLEGALIPGPERIPDWLGLLFTLALWTGAVAAGTAMGLAVALFLAAPILERLSARVEARVRNQAVNASPGLRWEILQSLRGALYFLGAAPLVFAVSLIPLVGPALGAFWTARVIAFQLTDAPLTRRGLAFADRRAWHRRWRAESMGFGVAGTITLLVPFANLLLGPALTVGGTLLVVDLEPEPPAGPEPPAEGGATAEGAPSGDRLAS